MQNIVHNRNAAHKRLLWVIDKRFDVAPDTATWLEMASNLKQWYDVALLTGYRKRKIQFESKVNNIFYYESSPIPFVGLFHTYISQCRSFAKIFRIFEPHVLIFNSSNYCLLRYAARLKRTNTQLLYDVRSLPVGSGRLNQSFYHKLLGLNLRAAVQDFDGISYITDEMRRFCVKKYRLLPHPSFTWTSAVDPQSFFPTLEQPTGSAFKMIYHGTIAKKRRLDNVLKALPLLPDLNIQLHLLGSGEAVGELKQLAETLNLKDKVLFHDTVKYSDVPGWINQCHVGILPFPNWPGWNTSSPIKLFEYLACGRPVIVTNIAAHRNVLNGKDFAFWAEESSPQALSNAIRSAHARRASLARLGIAARNFVMERYTWTQQANKMYAFLNPILDGAKRQNHFWQP